MSYQFRADHAAHHFHFGAHHRLLVGDDGESLQGRASEPQFVTRSLQAREPGATGGPGEELITAGELFDLKRGALVSEKRFEAAEQAVDGIRILETGRLGEPPGPERLVRPPADGPAPREIRV